MESTAALNELAVYLLYHQLRDFVKITSHEEEQRNLTAATYVNMIIILLLLGAGVSVETTMICEKTVLLIFSIVAQKKLAAVAIPYSFMPLHSPVVVAVVVP